MNAQRPPVIFMMGPTGAGKTAAAVWLARRFPFEIISVDSALVYRGMDVGTAKPGRGLLREIPHHLIDICDPAESYSAARFRDDALRVIAEILARGKTPLLVGGTGLYFRVLETGIAPLPVADSDLRARLSRDKETLGLQAMHDRLRQVDPCSAGRIHPNDPQRILRALEVFELTGKPLSELWTAATVSRLVQPLLKLVVAPQDRAVLHRRIETRFRTMLDQGLINEVRKLRERIDLDPHKPALRAVGYQQVWQYLDGRITFAEMQQSAIVATRQLAKRQFTWFRREAEATWLDSEDRQLLDAAARQLEAQQIRPYIDYT